MVQHHQEVFDAGGILRMNPWQFKGTRGLPTDVEGGDNVRRCGHSAGKHRGEMTNTHDSLFIGTIHEPRVQLVPATLSNYNALHSLAQFYQYDFTEFLPGDVDADGEYPFIDVRRYLTEGHRAYLARVNGKLGGFVLVRDRPEQRDRPGRYLAEFFVMRPYRRLGVGRTLAFQTFDTYRGYWELAVVSPNTPAQAFWRKVVGQYTRGRFEEFTTQDNEAGSTITIIWQAFDSRAW